MSRKLSLCDTPGLCNTKPNLVHGSCRVGLYVAQDYFLWTGIFLWRPLSQKSLKYCQWTVCQPLAKGGKYMSDNRFNMLLIVGQYCHQLWATCNRFFGDVCVCINVYTFTESPNLMQTVISLFVGKSLVSWIPEGHAGSWTSLKTLHSSPVCNGWGKTVALEYLYLYLHLEKPSNNWSRHWYGDCCFFFLLGCTEKVCNWTWGNKRKHKETPGKLQGGEVCQEFQ